MHGFGELAARWAAAQRDNPDRYRIRDPDGALRVLPWQASQIAIDTFRKGPLEPADVLSALVTMAAYCELLVHDLGLTEILDQFVVEGDGERRDDRAESDLHETRADADGETREERE